MQGCRYRPLHGASIPPPPAHTFLALSLRPDLHTGAPLLNLVTPLSFFSGKPCTASAAGSSVRVTCVSVEWWCGAGSRRPRSWLMAPWEDRNLPEGGAEPAGDSEPEGPEQEVSNTPGREYVQKLIRGGDSVGGGLRWMSWCCWRPRAVALRGRWGPRSRSQLLTVRFGRGSRAEESSEPFRSSHHDGIREDVQSVQMPDMPILTLLYLSRKEEIRVDCACSAN